MSVMAQATPPPVQDSAVATRLFRRTSPSANRANRASQAQEPAVIKSGPATQAQANAAP